ncbi:MAG: tyrosine-type recombinase/integrase, partial [Candidatus Tectomicrobia bacterium]|nr:tyrosine-type recombinase/integrase [Candidatus Tectomicrobia bacterium]
STEDFGLASTHDLVSNFIKSRREGLSPLTIKYYSSYLTRSGFVVGLHVQGQDIIRFLASLKCSGGGKHAYYRALRAFYTWLYSPKSGYGLTAQNNPMLIVDSPKRERRIMPSLTEEQVNTLVNEVDNLRDKVILYLLFDSGMRLSELSNVQRNDISWDTRTVTIIGKGNKQRRAPFTQRTGSLLSLYLGENHCEGSIWGINAYGIETMIKRLSQMTGIKFTCHSFRRGFACNLHRKGLSTLDIMHLGGWADLSMVLKYTHSITFDDCLAHYEKALGS